MIKTLAENLDFPEGPAFDSAGDLWCVELKGGNLICLKDGKIERIPTDGAPNGLAFDWQNRAVFCDAAQNAIRRYDSRTGKFETLADTVDGEFLNKPNDLAFDAYGNLLFTCPGDSRREPTGYVCCLKTDGTVKKIADKMFFPNGLAFAGDGQTLVVAETYRQRLWRGDWNADECEWTNAQPFADVGGNPGPDGMAFGANGLLHVAVYGSSEIKVVNESGRIIETRRLPGANPTNAAFDQSGKLGLVVSETELGLLLSIPEITGGVELFDGSRM